MEGEMKYVSECCNATYEEAERSACCGARISETGLCYECKDHTETDGYICDDCEDNCELITIVKWKSKTYTI